MALETATFLDGLVPSNPTSSDSAKAGDDHIRLIKDVLKNTFPNLNAAVTRTPTQLNFPVPIGTIVMWSSTAGSIPTGWGLCDGSSYTRTDGAGSITAPDLRDRFVVGAGSTYSPGNSGGAVTKTSSSAGSHNHTASAASAGSHTHTVSVSSSGAHTHTGTTDADGGHAHGGDTGSAGNHDHGGSTQSHTLTSSQIPPHRHLVVHDDTGDGDLTASNSIVWTRGSGGDFAYGLRSDGTSGEPTLGRTSDTGGGNGHTHGISSSGSHTHTISAVSDHTHTFSIASSGAHTHSATTGSDGSHTHTLTVDAGGAHDHTVNVLPPYFALQYIMKH